MFERATTVAIVEIASKNVEVVGSGNQHNPVYSPDGPQIADHRTVGDEDILSAPLSSAGLGVALNLTFASTRFENNASWAPGTDSDTVAPKCKVKAPRKSQFVKRGPARAAGSRLTIRVSKCDESANVRVSGNVKASGGSASAAKKLKLKTKKGSVEAGAKKKFKLKAPKKTRKVTSRTRKRGGKAIAKIKVTLTDEAGNNTKAKVKIKLTT